MALSPPEIISSVALLLAIGSALWQRFGVILDIKKEQGTMALSFQEKLGKVKDECVNELNAFKDVVQRQFTNQGDAFYGQFDKLSAQLAVIDNRLSRQEMKVELFWAAVQDTVKNMIKQPIHFRKDELLDKFPNLDYDEICELKSTLVDEKKAMLSLSKDKLTADQKVYLIALGLMLAATSSRLIDMELKC